MINYAITARELAKSYHIYPSPRHRLWQMLLAGNKKLYTEFAALKPISFAIRPGETVGIVGRNGSGKSTLLQLIAGTLTPSAGTIDIAGKVAALLELGAGFNPDFTGRENLLLNGSILGMSKAEIEAASDKIIEFANIGDFIDRPISTYSSGMVVRLAFSIATASRPDIMIIDEALSVGDEAFQRKCFARISSMKEAGTTILFVSHSSQAVIQVCDRVLWLDEGMLIMDDTPKIVIDKYHQYLHAPQEQRQSIKFAILANDNKQQNNNDQNQTAHDINNQLLNSNTQQYPAQGGRISDLVLLDKDHKPVNVMQHGQSYIIRYKVQLTTDVSNIRCGMLLKTRTGVEVAGAVMHMAEHGIKTCKSGDCIEISFKFTCLLYPRSYFLNCGVMADIDGQECYLHRLVDVMELQVINPTNRNEYGVSPEGLVDLNFCGKYKLLTY